MRRARPLVRMRLRGKALMPIHVDHATSEVVPDRDEAEGGGAQAGQSWQAQEHVRAALAAERADRDRTRAEGYGD